MLMGDSFDENFRSLASKDFCHMFNLNNKLREHANAVYDDDDGICIYLVGKFYQERKLCSVT